MSQSMAGNLAVALERNGFSMVESEYAQSIGAAFLVRSAFKWKRMARMHTFVPVFVYDHGPALDEVKERSAQALALSIKLKGGLPRGLQTGTITLPIFCGSAPSEEVLDWFRAQPPHRYAALEFPVFVDDATRDPIFFLGRLNFGWVYQEYIEGVVRDVVLKGLGANESSA